MKISDFKGLKKKTLAEIISIDHPYGDYYTIKLKVDPYLKWEVGEHAIFKLPDNNVQGKKWRAFSIASTSDEGFILLGTRTGEEMSSFKKELLSMNKGEKVSVRGPFGWFKLQDKVSPLVMFAGGVGITPIRALLKEVENHRNRHIEVVYASNDYYLFGDEIEEIAEKNDHITLRKTNSSKETTQVIEVLANKYGNTAYYYNSGSPKALKSIKKQMKNLGIKGKRIIDDSFLGY